MKKNPLQKLMTAAFVTAAVPLLAQSTVPQVTWHWHMHQPIYWNDQKNGAPDRYEYAWESIVEKDNGRVNPTNNLREIFGKDDRVAAYQYRMRDSLSSIGGNHPDSGVASSYSGALMENIKSLGDANQLGYNSNWKGPLQQANGWTTGTGAPRFDFTNFSFHHALLALHNDETVYMELRLMQEMLKREFGESSIGKGFFPTEMCFSTRLIPIINELGIEWTIVSGEKIARATPDFPLQLGTGGVNCSPPNKADQINPMGNNFIRTTISRGCSPVNANPLSYQPAYAQHVDPETGEITKTIVVPADQGFGWLDGYQCIDASFLDALDALNDPTQPSLVVLSHDGDNAFGGGASYYQECVPGVANNATSRGNSVTAIQEYLNNFPPPVDNVIHVEDGGWVNADSDFGSPSFINWNYPLLDAQGNIDPVNGWHEKPRDMAIFTAALNRVLTAQQISGRSPDFAKILDPDGSTHPVDRAWHYYLGSLDSGNVYFGPAEDLEVKATIGCNEAVEHTDPIIGDGSNDQVPPTIWLPQRSPYNPGGLNFGVQHGYQEYYDDGDFHIWTFVSDVNEVTSVNLKYRIDADGTNPLSSTQNETFAGGAEVGDWVTLPMNGRVFPKGNIYSNPQIDFFELPEYISDHYSVEVTGLREVLIDYYVEAVDSKGNSSYSPIQHVWIGDGANAGGGVGGGVKGTATVSPDPLQKGEMGTITFDATGGPLQGISPVYIEIGTNGFQNVISPRPQLTSISENVWEYSFTVPGNANSVECAFASTSTGGGIFDNNGGEGIDYRFTTDGDVVIDPNQNPFVMDGVLDAGVCTIENDFHVKVQNGWVYVAANNSGNNDGFIYVSEDPTLLRQANWGKSGQIGSWNYFLAMEGTNAYRSWFNASEASVVDDAMNQVSARNGTFIEGAIKLSNITSGDQVNVAYGSFGTADSGTLLSQIPLSVNSDANIDASEFVVISATQTPCGEAAPQEDDLWIMF